MVFRGTPGGPARPYPWPAASTEQRVDGEDDQLDLEYSTASRSRVKGGSEVLDEVGEGKGEGGLIRLII